MLSGGYPGDIPGGVWGASGASQGLLKDRSKEKKRRKEEERREERKRRREEATRLKPPERASVFLFFVSWCSALQPGSIPAVAARCKVPTAGPEGSCPKLSDGLSQWLGLVSIEPYS